MTKAIRKATTKLTTKKGTKYVALLRGINVGGNSKVEMSKLKKVFEGLGFSNVSTYINSGNVIFEVGKGGALGDVVDGIVDDAVDNAALVAKIEKSLHKSFGFEIRVVVRDSRNIQKICKAVSSDWTNDTEQKTDVLFLWDEFDNKKSIDLINTTEVDDLRYISGAIVWNVKRVDYKKSGMNKFIGTKVYKNMTARNINTVRKLGELMG